MGVIFLTNFRYINKKIIFIEGKEILKLLLITSLNLNLFILKMADFFLYTEILQSPIFEDFKNILVQNPFLGSH